MPGRGSQRSHVRRQPLEKLEDLCSEISADPAQPLTLDALLVVENSVPENSQSSLWDSVSERALLGLLSIYAASIRCSSPLLESGSARHLVEHYAFVRAALSRQLATAGALDADRSRRLALSILRSQTLRCYAVLLGDAADSLLRHPSKRNEDCGASLLSEVDGIALFVSHGAKGGPGSDSPSPSEVLQALESELTASSLLEHWARLLLALAGCEGSKRALDIAAANVACLSRALTAFLGQLHPDCAHSLLASSPCLSYFAASQLIGLCVLQDFGTAYGMPRVPCGALFEAVLALQPARMVVSGFPLKPLDAFAEFAQGLLAALPVPPERPLQQHGDPFAPGSDPTANNPVVAGGEASNGHVTAAGEAPALAGAAGATAAAAAAQAQAQAQEPGHREWGSGNGVAAAALAGGRSDRQRPLLVNPLFCLEFSLRLVTALCANAGRLAAPPPQGAGGGTGRCPDEWQPLARVPPLPSVWLGSISSIEVGNAALALARRLIHDTPSAAAAAWLRTTGRRGSGGSACTPAAHARTAPSPLERWWEGAVAVGGPLATAAWAAAGPNGERAQQKVDGALSGYFEQLELVLAASAGPWVPGPPAQPSESVAAALSTGFLPCLERLLPAVLPLALTSEWYARLGPGWAAAWPQMLAFGEKGQTAAVVCAAAEGLRKAVAACPAGRVQSSAFMTTPSGNSGSGDCGTWQLINAASIAIRLADNTALCWLLRSARGPASEPGTSEGGPAAAPAPAPAPTTAACGPATRLGGSLSLIAARLLPELSRSVLEALLPWADSGVTDWDTVYISLERLLAWVPTLVAALVAEPSPAAPAVAESAPAAAAAEPKPAAAAAEPALAAAVAEQAMLVATAKPSPAAEEPGPAATAAYVAGGSSAGSTDGGARQDSGSAMRGSGGGTTSCSALRWRQLLLIELRLPRLLGAALGLSLGRNDTHEGGRVSGMHLRLRTALLAFVVLAPAELARMVAAADRAEAAAPGRAASGRGPAGGPAPHSPPPPPSSGLLRRALGPGGPLEDAVLLAAVEAACAGGAGKGPGLPVEEAVKRASETLHDVEGLLSGARLLSLQG